MARIASLVANGQIYSFVKYEDCYSACVSLIQQYRKLQAVAGFISSSDWNWENTKLVETCNNALSLKAEDVEQDINQQSIKFIKFAKENYGAIYKNT